MSANISGNRSPISGTGKIGCYGTSVNRQYEYDHKGDAALFMDKAFAERKIGVLKTAYEAYKELAGVHGGSFQRWSLFPGPVPGPEIPSDRSDGMIADYTCGNYGEEEENRRYIRENVLMHFTPSLSEGQAMTIWKPCESENRGLIVWRHFIQG